ncbi:conjugal transfer protein TraN [Sphingobium sp. H39-3-25]|uniref:conjugal transfer protein TraN n=1 Tax=Sphingomonadales TaxID=204457 RepID=UPI000A923356|nr:MULTISPECIES: conjugal transfer protein TraN [Sphingomonadaceae]MDF0491110.1 conjugal transfer protein TraN [Sphingomonas pollutisoli]MDF0545159.1 conjugal transfer protein TraN [Sphingobium arseniciresistens]
MTRLWYLGPRAAACMVALGIGIGLSWHGTALAQPLPQQQIQAAGLVEPQPEPDPAPGGETPSDPQSLQLCAADLNGNGDAADPGETAYCTPTPSGQFLCPIQEVDCVADAAGQYSCPLGPQLACIAKTTGGVPACSPNQCADIKTNPIVDEPPIADPGTEPDGGMDAEGNCMGTIEIFSGRGMRCRPPGLSTTLSNCCKDKGKIVKDGMGSSLSSISTKIAVAKGVFNGMKAAYAAFQAGATASQAANAGLNALVVGFDPTSIAVSLAINFMIDFLFSGCDQQDMETAMLRSSGFCHEIGSYCTSSFLGICLQKARGHCCFNTKLGRIIQEQGRPQLKSFNGNLWGTAKKPMCRGFTPEEFQALDFSKMDLSEYYADIEARAQSDIQIDMKERVDAYLNAVKP